MRAIVVLTIASVLVAFGTIQFASYSLNAQAAAPGTLPTRIAPSFGLAVYRALDFAAPAPFVLSTLATQALASGDLPSAQRYAVRLPASPIRDELLARISQARGDGQIAYEYYLAAPDVAAVQTAIEARERRDPAAAYALERVLEVRLARLTTHPDDVAEARFREGLIANQQAFREVPASRRQGFWLGRGMDAFVSAVDLAPLSDKYLIAAANQAMLLGNLDRAQSFFARAAGANPGSADALAGLGTIAYQRGDVAAARGFLERARRLDARALMVLALQRDLDQPNVKTIP
jgi:tetratricopeptide (TPR) repeat protein